MSKLREAAQTLLEAVEDEGVRGMDTAIKALRDALVESESEYPLVGRFVGTLNGRFVFAPEDNKIWPVDTALYARIEE